MSSGFQPQDHGPIYRETIQAQSRCLDDSNSLCFVEPWNAFSNIIFLLVLIYWYRQIHQQRVQSIFLHYCLGILTLGFVGGTLYHATRSHQLWFLLDVVPIAVLMFSVAIFFWKEVLGTWWHAIVVTIAFWIGMNLLIFQVLFPGIKSASVTYSMMALGILLPVLWHLRKNAWRNYLWLLGTLISYAIAISFRELDAQPLVMLPQGTHFLWHLFGGISVHFFIGYIFRSIV